MIITISLRDNHPDDLKIAKWYKGITKSERSREVRRVLSSSIFGRTVTLHEHVEYNNITKPNKTNIPNTSLEPINIVKEESSLDLDRLLDSIGIGG